MVRIRNLKQRLFLGDIVIEPSKRGRAEQYQPETQRQATQHDCMPRLLGDGTNEMKRYAVRKIIFCTGLHE